LELIWHKVLVKRKERYVFRKVRKRLLIKKDTKNKILCAYMFQKKRLGIFKVDDFLFR